MHVVKMSSNQEVPAEFYGTSAGARKAAATRRAQRGSSGKDSMLEGLNKVTSAFNSKKAAQRELAGIRKARMTGRKTYKGAKFNYSKMRAAGLKIAGSRGKKLKMASADLKSKWTG